MLLYGEIEKTSALILGGRLLVFISLMYRSSHDVLPARPRFEVGEAVPTPQGVIAESISLENKPDTGCSVLFFWPWFSCSFRPWQPPSV